jgi:hypothetical protein
MTAQSGQDCGADGVDPATQRFADNPIRSDGERSPGDDELDRTPGDVSPDDLIECPHCQTCIFKKSRTCSNCGNRLHPSADDLLQQLFAGAVVLVLHALVVKPIRKTAALVRRLGQRVSF